MSRRRWALLALSAVAAARGTRAADIAQVLPAALDQPQINAIVYVGANTMPQVGVTSTIDPNTLDTVTANTFTVTAYLDTGASSILISNPTNTIFNIPTLSANDTNGTLQPVIYSDVGVAGTDDFQVSTTVRLSLANYYPRTDLDQFSDPAQTIPITTPYTPIPAPHSSVRVQIGPYVPTVDNPIIDEISQLIADLGAVDVVGMPAMTGRVVVIDPSHVNNFGTILDQFFADPLNFDLTQFENTDLSAHTFIYAPGTPFHPATVNTDPGIPATQLHVQLSYASFDRFTTVSPAGQPGPTLEHNPFIGQNPVALLDGIAQPPVPGIKIARFTVVNGVPTILTSEGNWLLDTGAAASIISKAQAAHLDVTYQPGTFGTDTPVLIDQNGVALPHQFTLTIAGVGGQETLAGFYLDSLLIRTLEGKASNDNDPNHIRFVDAPVLVGDVTVKDPVTLQTLTLDGIFGMNNLIASADFSVDPTTGGIGDFTASTSVFNWLTFDEPNGILGLSFYPVSLGDGAQQFTVSQPVGPITGSALSSVTVDAGATLTSGAVSIGTLHVNGIHVIFSNTSLTGRTSTVGALVLAGAHNAWTGTLDLTNNNLIVSNDPEVANQIKYAAALGAWNGPGGITSSSAKNSLGTITRTALGYATGAEYTALTQHTLFDGLPFASTDTLIMYTLAGDANLDGTVNINDFFALSAHFNQAGDWSQGDVNYDGGVNINDFFTMSGNWAKTLAVGSLLPGAASAASAASSVPEPASLLVLSLAGVALLVRRRPVR